MVTSIRRVLSLLLLVGTGTAFAAAPIPAGKAGSIPTELPVLSNAMFVLHVNGFEKTKDKIGTFLKTAIPKHGEGVAKKIDEWLQSMLSGRELKGMSKEGRCYLAVHDFIQVEDHVSFAIPCDDSKAFLNGFFPKEKVTSREKKTGFEVIESDGVTFYVVERASYVVFALNEEIAGEYTKKFDGIKSKSMGDAAELFFQSDVSLYFNVEQINEIHGEQIKQFQQFFNQALDQAAQAGAMGMDRRQLELTKAVYAGIFQMVEDGKSFALGLEMKPQGMQFRVNGLFKPASVTGKFLAKERPIQRDELNRLPNGYTFYSGSSLGEGAMKIASTLSREYTASESDEAGTKSLAEWAAIQSRATSSVTFGDFGKTIITITKHPEARKAADAYGKAMKSLGEGGKYQSLMLKGKPVVSPMGETFQGIAFRRVIFTMDYEATFKILPDEVRKTMTQAVKRIIPENVSVYYGADDRQLVQITEFDPSLTKAAVKNAFESKNTIGDSDPGKTTLAMLPAESSNVLLFEVGKGMNFLIDYASSIMSAFASMGIADLPKLKTVTSEPTYVGSALVFTGNRASIDIFVPKRAVTVIAEMVEPLFENKEQ